MNITVISDIHFGYENISNSELLVELHRAVDEFKDQTDTLIVLGDIIHEGGDMDGQTKLDKVLDVLDQDEYNLLMTGGNHDAHELDAVDLKRLSTPEPMGCYLLDTAMESPLPDAGFIDESKAEEIAEHALSGRDMDTLFTHFPPVYTELYQDSNWFDEYPEGAFPLNKHEYEGIFQQFDRIVCAHLHIDGSDEWRGVEIDVNPPFISFEEDSVTGDYSTYEI
jgi:3',5'-cyclic AMP phosphodiesterase CpdA